MRFYESTVGGKSILLPGSPFPEDAGGEVKKTVTRPKKITVINKPNR
jgi:hypothetical protein